MTDLFQHPIVQGAVQGFMAAAVVDVLAFRKWQRWEDAVVYDWRVASWRWVQGTITGALVAFGVQGVL